MKKKYTLLTILCAIILLFTTGCVEGDNLEGSSITTTVYPIEFLVSRLYGGDKSTITSIYPNETNTEEYTMTDKKINEYAKKTTLFVYNGLTNEKEIAKSLINKNKKIQIIDVSYGIKYKYGVEELWLNPNNFLMLANTIKGDLQSLSSSKYAAEEIEKNYNKLEEDLTTMDAGLRSIAKTASKNKSDVIVIACDSLSFLEKYGFKVINITNENDITSAIKNKFKDKSYKHIFVDRNSKVTDSVKDLVDNFDANLIEVNMMSTLTDNERANGDNYLTIMNEFISKISNVVLS